MDKPLPLEVNYENGEKVYIDNRGRKAYVGYVDSLSSAELLAEVPKMTYRQLDHWCRKGYMNLLHEGIYRSEGSGTRRSFPMTIVPKLRIICAAIEHITYRQEGRRTSDSQLKQLFKTAASVEQGLTGYTIQLGRLKIFIPEEELEDDY
ncbi:MAG: hypothetical protein MN733_01270 [Nitrososphaera sp.]|nr:hypothetical protein [Nitrososphaera sp.]